jgi:hypothetical protein
MAIIKDFITRSGVIIQGTAAVTSSTGQSGSLQVNGGAAISKNLIVGLGAQIYGVTNLYSGLNVDGPVQFNGTFTITSAVNLQNNVIIDGTLGVTGNATLASLTVTNATVLNGLLTSNNTATFNAPVIVSGSNSLTVGTGSSTFGGIVSLTGNESATTAGAGTLRVTGGIYAGNNVVINGTGSNTVTNTSNALYVAGGAWIEKNLVVTGNTIFRDSVTFQGTTTNVYSTNTYITDNIINLHTPQGGPDDKWTFDDGKDIGIKIHYYANSTDTNAALVLSNNNKFLEWYSTGAEGTSTFVGTTFGTFRTGSIRLMDTTSATSTTTGALQVIGGVGVGGAVYSGGNVSGETVNARNLTQGRIVYVGTGGQLIDSGNLTFDGTNLSATVTTATSSNNLLGGATGSIPFQTATNQTVFLPIGAGGQVLAVLGGVPVWTNLSGLSSGNATTSTNIAGGTIGQVPYQTGAGATSFFGPGTAGQLLQSNGAAAPSYVNTGNVFVGFAVNAISVSTVRQNTNALHYPAFVDSNNASATSESVYTTSSFTINPADGAVTIGGPVTIGSASSGVTVNALYSNNVLLSSYTSPALVSTSTVTLDTLSTSTYRTARYTVQVVRGANVHVTEAVIFHDGTNAYINEYGISTTAGELGVFDATLQTGNMLFTFAPSTTASTVVKVVRMALTS